MTEQMSTLWENGVQLNAAHFEFAPKKLKAQWKSLKSVSVIEVLGSEVQKASETGQTGLEAIQAALSEPQRIVSARSTLTTSMHDFLLHHLKAGNFVAYGFETPRKLDDAPRELPARLWAARPDWGKSSLTSEGLKFIEVRIVTRDQKTVPAGASTRRGRLLQSQGPPHGRPGHRRRL